MWSILDTDNETVVAVMLPDSTIEQVIKESNGRKYIRMTIENSPAGIGWKWDGQKFHEGEKK
jgi:hypothetical protein